MNCQAIQNKILAMPDPRHIPDSLRDHVAGCAGCREWAQQAARLEGLLAQLPAPPAPANKKEDLLAELSRPEPVITRPVTVPIREGYAKPVLRFLRGNARLVGGLAAAVLVALGGWWLVTHRGTPDVATNQPTPKDPFIEKLVQRDIALARADTAAKKLQVLGGLADDLSTQTRALARVANPNDLNELAGLFDKVVKGGLEKQVDNLPTLDTHDEKQKQELCSSLAKKLGDMAAEADRLAGEVPPEAKPALQKIASSAREGQKKFRS
jgi:hypothetical protein